MSNPNIQYIVVSTTGACNLSCRHCFRVEANNRHLLYDAFVSRFDAIKSMGVKYINFTGGEPLLNPDIAKMINESKKYGFKNILSTNGMLLPNLKTEILEDIFYLCLPLDGYDSSTNDKIRGDGHFDKVLSLINEYKQGVFNFKLKINTLVTAYNIDNLRSLPLLLQNIPSIHLKLFQVSTRGNVNFTNPNDFISDEKFLDLYNFVVTEYPNISVNYLMANSPSNYIIINSDGLFKYVQNDDYIDINDIQELPFKKNSFKQVSLGI